jgi:hypothetical protein
MSSKRVSAKVKLSDEGEKASVVKIGMYIRSLSFSSFSSSFSWVFWRGCVRIVVVLATYDNH